MLPTPRCKPLPFHGGAARLSSTVRRTSLRLGMMSRIAKSRMKGTLSGSPPSPGCSTTYFTGTVEAIPITRPPTKVIGMFEKSPNAAAPKAWTTSRVSAMGPRPRLGTISTPERAAKTAPMIHAYRRTRVAFVPIMSSRSESSTTARIATPVRDQRKNAKSPMTAMTEMAMIVSES
jgi:hypothetical protein